MSVPADLEARIVRVLDRAAEPLAAVYLFGSRARGEAGPGSDVDLGVFLGGPAPPGLDGLLLSLEGRLESTLGVPVQLVVLDTAPPDVVHRVLRDGRLLFDRDPAARIRFQVRARNEYFDIEPFLRRYRKTEAAGPPRR